MTLLQHVLLLIVAKATLILGFVAVLFVVAGRRWPRSCALWQRFGVMALLILPVAVWAAPLVKIPLLAPAAPSVVGGGALFPPPGDMTIPMRAGDNLATPESATALDQRLREPVPETVLISRSSRSAGSAATRGAILVTCLAGLYGFVVLGLVVRFVRGWLGLRRLERSSPLVADARWQATLRHWMNVLQLSRPVELRVSPDVSVAMTFGWRSPIILVPRDCIDTCDETQREAIVIHELTHIARGDFFWHALTQLTVALYWAHPLMWLIRRQEGIARERICDAFCLQRLSRESYAQALVRIAGRNVIRPAVALGMAMAHQSSLKRRLTDLESWTPGRCSTPGLAQRIVLCGTAALVLGLIVLGTLTARVSAQGTRYRTASAAERSAAQSAVQDSPTSPVDVVVVRLPATIEGKVVDPEEKPVARARVTITIERATAGVADPERWTATTDELGRYTVSVGEQSLGPDDYVHVKVQADGFPESSTSPDSRELANGTFPVQKLRAGRMIQGRLVDSSGNHIADAVVGCQANSADMTLLWNAGLVKTGQDGTFSITIPKEGKAALAIYPRDFAPRIVDVPEGGGQLGLIRIERGTSIRGRVTDRQGRGVAGTVVAIQSTEHRVLHAYLVVLATAIKTDETGSFAFPPVRGSYKVWVTDGAPDFSRRGGYVTGVKPPPILPQKVDLNGTDKIRELVLVEGVSATVRGTVRWSDGSPVPDVKIEASMMPAGWGIGTELGSGRTDGEGRYALRVPVPLSGVSLYANQFVRAPDGTYQQAKAVGRGADRGNQYRSITIDRLTRDIDGADWQVNAKEPADSRTLNLPEGPADQGLDELGRRVEAAKQEYTAALQKAATREEQLELFKTLNPGNRFAGEFLAFEQKYRGTSAAVGVMHHVLRGASGVSDPESRIAQGRVRLVETMMRHYLQHEDLDLLLAGFQGGPYVREAEALFRKALESPHAAVRAAALHYGAAHEAQKIESENLVAEYLRLAPGNPEVQTLGERVQRTKASIGDVNVEECRRRAVELLDRLIREYPELVIPRLRLDGPTLLRYAKVKQPDRAGAETFADRARDLRFRVADLQIGRVVPDFTARSLDGKEISLAGTRGLVTVLLFSSSGEIQSPAIRAELKKLLEQYPEKLTIFEVYTSRGEEPVPQEPEVGWPVVLNGRSDASLSKKWTSRWPHVVIVDGGGRLQSDTALAVSFPRACVKAVLERERR